MNKSLCFLGALAFSTFVSYAQNSLPRIEINVREDFENFKAFPLENKQLVLISNAEKSEKGNLEIKSDFYNEELKLVESKSVYVKDRSSVYESYQENGINYTLVKNKRDYVAIIISDTNNNTIRKVEATVESDTGLTDMIVKHNKAYFRTVEDKTDLLVIIDLETAAVTKTPFEIDSIKNKDLEIKDYQVVDDEVIVFLNTKISKTTSDLYFVTLDLNGTLKQTVNLTKNVSEKLISVSATKSGFKYILTGTYSKTKSDMSQGIYMAEVNNQSLQFIKFYNFTDLNKFTSYMSDRNQRKIERKAENAEKHDKELLLNYNIATHDVKVVDGYYIFIGEAYVPIYVTVNNGRMISQQFAGYHYTHAVICKFDQSGNLIWDNSFEMSPRVRPYIVKKFIKPNFYDNMVDLSFGDLHKLFYKKIDLTTGFTLKDKDAELMNIDSEGDKVKRSNASLEYWHDQYFVAFGTQVLTNSDAKGKRKIFFLNKVSFDKN